MPSFAAPPLIDARDRGPANLAPPECKGEAVEPPAQLTHGGGVFPLEPERWLARTGKHREQLDAVEPCEVPRIVVEAFGAGLGQRRDGKHPLPVGPQNRAARNHVLHASAGTQQLRDLRARRGDAPEIVEHEKQAAPAQVLDKRGIPPPSRARPWRPPRPRRREARPSGRSGTDGRRAGVLGNPHRLRPGPGEERLPRRRKGVPDLPEALPRVGVRRRYGGG